MKVAISSTGKELDNEVDARFGRCSYFLIVDISNPSNWIDIPSILNFVITIVSIGVIVSLILLKLKIQKKNV